MAGFRVGGGNYMGGNWGEPKAAGTMPSLPAQAQRPAGPPGLAGGLPPGLARIQSGAIGSPQAQANIPSNLPTPPTPGPAAAAAAPVQPTPPVQAATPALPTLPTQATTPSLPTQALPRVPVGI